MIYLIINIILSALPAFLLVLYFYRKDSVNKEPPVIIWKTFVLGFFSVLPAALLETVLLPAASFSINTALARAFLVAGLVEEGIKLSVVMLYIYRKPEFDEISDGMIYTITASMGFACFENLLYSTGGAAVLLIRGITAVPLHAAASGIMGYYIGLSKFGDTKKQIAKGLLLAVLIHGTYDFLLFTGSFAAFGVIPLLAVSIHLLLKRFGEARNMDATAGRG